MQLKELKRAVNELGFVGAVLPAVGLRQPLGDPRYFPVLRGGARTGRPTGGSCRAHPEELASIPLTGLSRFALSVTVLLR
jgi:hypothetical protein